MPTIADFQTTTTRATRQGYRVLIVAGSHVEIISAATGRVMDRLGSWEEVDEWLTRIGQEARWKRAA